MVHKKLLNILACPQCKGKLELKENSLICHQCQLKYPIKDEIPVMLIDEAEKLK